MLEQELVSELIQRTRAGELVWEVDRKASYALRFFARVGHLTVHCGVREVVLHDNRNHYSYSIAGTFQLFDLVREQHLKRATSQHEDVLREALQAVRGEERER